jgi:RNA polymerase sigma-70 factor (ECF subfamily)
VPHADAEDLVHDVFLTAMNRLGSLRDGAAFGGWLAVIARHRAADFHRRGPREETAPERPALDGSLGASPAAEQRPSDAHSALDARAALAAVHSLPAAYRETLVLRLVEGMTGPEIAERTGLTPASVRVNLCRGMKLLREALGWSQGHE